MGRCARMDFVAKILIDQQDIAGRMSRGGEFWAIV